MTDTPGPTRPKVLSPRVPHTSLMIRPVFLVLIAAAFLSVEPAPAGRAAAGPCTAQQTRAVAYAFAAAWTRGDLVTVERLVAREPHFRWVSAGPPGGRAGPRAFDRATLRAFIRARHARHERLTLTWFRFNGSDLREKQGFGHFEFHALRRSDDWPAQMTNSRKGKGAIICTLSRPVLAVWSLG